MKLKSILNESVAHRFVQRFKHRFPEIKEEWWSPPKYIISHLLRWWGPRAWDKMKPTNISYDYRSVAYWNSIDIDDMPPIIVGMKNDRYVILDGQHRAYSVFIVRKLPKIKALVTEKTDSLYGEFK